MNYLFIFYCLGVIVFFVLAFYKIAGKENAIFDKLIAVCLVAIFWPLLLPFLIFPMEGRDYLTNLIEKQRSKRNER